jgi:hypothetical protein
VDIEGTLDLKIDTTTGEGSLLSVPFLQTEAFVVTPRGFYFRKLFFYRDTMGLPLTILFDILQQASNERKAPVNPCCRDFVSRAVCAGWNESTARSELEEAFIEYYGPKDGRMAYEQAMGAGFWFQPVANPAE